MNQPPDIRNEFIVIFGCLFVFCVLEAIFGADGPYIFWAAVFGFILALLIQNKR